MLKTLQILKYLKSQGLSQNEIFAEFTEIVDNGRSEYFELSDNDIVSISNVFYNESKFEAACKVTGVSK